MKRRKSGKAKCTECGKKILPRWTDPMNPMRTPLPGSEPLEWFHKAHGRVECHLSTVATPPEGTKRPLPDIPWKVDIKPQRWQRSEIFDGVRIEPVETDVQLTGTISYRDRPMIDLTPAESAEFAEIMTRFYVESGGDYYVLWNAVDALVEKVYATRGGGLA